MTTYIFHSFSRESITNIPHWVPLKFSRVVTKRCPSNQLPKWINNNATQQMQNMPAWAFSKSRPIRHLSYCSDISETWEVTERYSVDPHGRANGQGREAPVFLGPIPSITCSHQAGRWQGALTHRCADPSVPPLSQANRDNPQQPSGPCLLL